MNALAKLVATIGLFWMLLVTFLLLHVIINIHALVEHQATLPARTVELLSHRAQAERVTCPPPPPQKCPLVACPQVPENAAILPVDQAQPERIRPVLHWMGLDGGRDLFLHLITWNKPARQSHALIIEVGAGDGRQAVKAAQLGFRVISVDASSSNLQIGNDFLSQALQQGPLDGNLTWKHSAVSDYTGEAHFWTRKGIGRLLDNSDPHSVTHKDNPKWRGETEKVPVNKLDDLIAPSERPYILKVDVEGHELSVFRGARRILEQRPPIVIFEFNPAMIRWSAHHDPYELLKLFHDLGYELYDTQISEPGTKGFLKKYGSFHRPSGFRDFVRWLNQSTEFDWWGSWTDIVAIYPQASG